MVGRDICRWRQTWSRVLKKGSITVEPDASCSVKVISFYSIVYLIGGQIWRLRVTEYWDAWDTRDCRFGRGEWDLLPLELAVFRLSVSFRLGLGCSFMLSSLWVQSVRSYLANELMPRRIKDTVWDHFLTNKELRVCLF